MTCLLHIMVAALVFESTYHVANMAPE